MALKQNVSLFMMPFFIKDWQEKKFEPSDKSIWAPCQMAFDKGKLYTHIGDFLQPGNPDETSYHYQYYSLSENAGPLKEMLRKQMAIEVKNSDGTFRNIFFSIGQAEDSKTEREKNASNSTDKNKKIELSETQESFFSPKLVICPSAGIGMLILSVQLDKSTENKENFSLNNLIDLNYAIFKTYPLGSSQTQPILLKSQIDIRDVQQKLDSEQDEKMKKRYEKQLEGMRKKIPEKIKSTSQALGCEVSFLGDKAEWFWTMTELTNRLMSEFNGIYERFDPYRLHVFTYFQVEESDLSEALLDDYIRIMKLQNKNYKVLNGANNSNIYEKSFDNIYMGCTVEGGAIMTLLPEQKELTVFGSTFIADFMQGSLSQSYLWTYVMIQIQRYTLLYIEQQLTRHNYMKNSLIERQSLRELIRSSTQNKVNSYFVDISDHTQHNQFYSLCCRNLKVMEYSDSVERKLELLTDYLKMLTEEEHEEEAKRRDNIGRWITVIGAVFALFSSSYDAFGLFGDEYLGFLDSTMPIYLRISIVLGSIAIVAIVFWSLAKLYIGRKH